MRISQGAEWVLHSGILALVDKQTTDGSQSHLVEVTPPGSYLQCPHPRSLLPQGPAFPFPSLGLSSALSQGRGRLGRERGSQDAQASVLISTKAASLSGLGPAAFPRGTLLNSPLLRAKLASPWGDGGGEGAVVVAVPTRCLGTRSPQSRGLRVSGYGLILWSGQVLGKGSGCRRRPGAVDSGASGGSGGLCPNAA